MSHQIHTGRTDYKGAGLASIVCLQGLTGILGGLGQMHLVAESILMAGILGSSGACYKQLLGFCFCLALVANHTKASE